MGDTILIVHPMEAVRRRIKEGLALSDVSFADAADAREAVRLLGRQLPDVILAASEMPGISGYELCEQVRAGRVHGAPVVLVIERATESDKARAVQAGATDVLEWPPSPIDLHLRIGGILERRHLERQLQQQNHFLYQLHQFATGLNSLETVEETMDATLIVAVSLTFSGQACILTPDETGANLRVARHLGVSDDVADTLRVRIGEPVSGTVFRDNVPVVVNDPSQMPPGLMEDAAFFCRAPFASLPVRTDDNAVGVLNVLGTPGRVYSDQDVKILRCIATTAAVAIQSQRRRLHADSTRDAAMVGLAALAEWRDPETGDHLERLRAYARVLAEGLRSNPKYARVIDRGFLESLSRSVPLHDIGKVGIPDHILRKPGKLTDEEFEIMKTHTEVGARVLAAVAARAGGDGFLQMARDIAYCHHEKWDGSGYPRGLAGDVIPLAARITAVADVYDALATDRVYRKAWPHAKVVEYILANSGTHFDPDIIKVFAARAGEFERLHSEMSVHQPGPEGREPSVVAVG